MHGAAAEPAAAEPKEGLYARLARRLAAPADGRYSRFVWAAKLVLPGVAILLLLAVVIASALHKTASDVTLTLQELGKLSGHLGMNNPTLTYTDAQNRNFLVNAKRATQIAGAKDVWDLAKIDGRMIPLQGTGYRLVSDSGMLDSGKKLLDLKGSVLVVSDQGYTFQTNSAHVDMNQNRVTSNEPVKAQGGVTNVRSDRFEMWDKGNKLRFIGRVHFVSESAPRKEQPANGAGTPR
jgi:lipopolysaccharide export system protein LptC